MKQITRGALHFLVTDQQPNQVRVSLGDSKDPESEHIMILDLTFIPDLIAGLTALGFVKSR